MKRILACIVLLCAVSPMLQAQHSPNRNARRDEKIREALSRILTHPQYKNVKADVDGAVVTLRGTVELASTRRELVQRIQKLALVESVENRVVLDPPAPPDKELYARVQRNLEDAGFGSLKIKVHEGSVTLEGMVASQELREKVLDLVRRTEGVKEIDSQLTFAAQ